jgi:hypothetical protein
VIADPSIDAESAVAVAAAAAAAVADNTERDIHMIVAGVRSQRRHTGSRSAALIIKIEIGEEGKR